MTDQEAILTDIPIVQPVDLDEIMELGDRASALIDFLRSRLLIPDRTKSPPMISSDKVADMCQLTKGQMAYRLKNGAPGGQFHGRGGRREFTVAEAQQWARAERTRKLRPDGAKAAVIGITFFKGGVSKTTSTMVLAQGLSLLGHRVLNIDLDPQGSLSTLHGLAPDADIAYEDTLAPLFDGDQDDVRYCIRNTYWPDLDLIQASSTLFSAEFSLPSRQMKDSSFEFWNVLNKGLEVVKDDYDVILIDTPPSLSYMTFNAFYAADGLLVPMTTNMLDIASSAQFWQIFGTYAGKIAEDRFDGSGRLVRKGVVKDYDFINILLSRVDNKESTTEQVKEWISKVYGEKVLRCEIPETTVTKSKVNQFMTVFDITKYEGDSRTYKRARDAYEELALSLEDSIRKVWARQLGAGA
ncbi:chromosome partitioning protein [Novimethylophilus kurashikiensis]|uniref:Chromosome partitioning protein n=1 Tax=Novimethylophilus kurashikiensis TaxID=1825523 RepID=A0A2R5F9K8_9PROT|nr:AAA family ATPase [Novimethylophilus kurashikiensis]GBG14499.1 chromosome partitioning protein [Novimethylophilus kurashikiensis]